jgi:hypothetical protein
MNEISFTDDSYQTASLINHRQRTYPIRQQYLCNFLYGNIGVDRNDIRHHDIGRIHLASPLLLRIAKIPHPGRYNIDLDQCAHHGFVRIFSYEKRQSIQKGNRNDRQSCGAATVFPLRLR